MTFSNQRGSCLKLSGQHKEGKNMKKLINVLWAIEKDLSVIASNTGAKEKFVPEHSKNKMSDKQVKEWFKHNCI